MATKEDGSKRGSRSTKSAKSGAKRGNTRSSKGPAPGRGKRAAPKTRRKTASKSAAGRMRDDAVVVGIGSSAGGLEALMPLLNDLPIGEHFIYVLVQHLDPNHPSMMASLLASSTTMEVKEAVDREQLAQDTVYVIPPNKNATLSDGVLHLSPPTAAIGPKPSVDMLFSSLAAEIGERAVGIVLSGTGTDGSHGVQAIKAAGGIVIVQDEETAKYNGMPNAAIRTGCADLILPPTQIGRELTRIIHDPQSLALEIDETSKNLQTMFRILQKSTNHDFSGYKTNTIRRRVERRLIANRMNTLEEYVQLLEDNRDEIQLLCKDILLSVTSFFRDEDAFKELDKIIADIVERKQDGENIRIWIPGCATGEEAYSVGILFARALGERLHGIGVQIYATDIDTGALNQARKGIFPMGATAKMDDVVVRRYFSNKGDTVEVAKALRDMVIFAKHDLVKDPPFAHLDLICCRNVLIYFKDTLQKRVISSFHYVLDPGGYLFLGKSETIGQFSDLFAPVDKRWRIFRRQSHGKQGPPAFLRKSYQRLSQMEPAPPKRAHEPSAGDLLRRAVMDHYAPKAVVINEGGDILYVHGDLADYLSLTEGESDLNIVKMAAKDLRVELRSVVHKSIRESTQVRGNVLKLTRHGEDRIVEVQVRPLDGSLEPTGLYMVSFEERAAADKSIVQQAGAEFEDVRLSELEHELATTREHLQTVVEELETSNEELQSVNEELQASNEELQSSNEELETTNEELQSTNEELITVNEELQVKTMELSMAKSDLENIQNSVGFPLIVVDEFLKIKRFTPDATTIFHMLPSDVGKTITMIKPLFSLPDLAGLLLKTIRERESYEGEISNGDEVYQLKIVPYLGDDQEVVGAILMFLDVGRLKAIESQVHELSAKHEIIMTSASEAVIVIDAHGVIESVSASFHGIFGYSAEEVVGRNVSMLMPSPDREGHDGYIDHYLQTGEARVIGSGREVTGRRKDGATVPLFARIGEIKVGKHRSFVGVVREIADRGSEVEILYVEDNDDDAELVLRVLRQRNLTNRLHRVKDGIAALDYLQLRGAATQVHAIPPKLVLLDLNLPELGGLEVLRRLREDERTRLLPVVVVTASEDARDLEEAYRLGVNSYVVKPVDFGQFSKAIGSLGMYWTLLNSAPAARTQPS